MPFKSQKQRRWMHANEPEMAERWEKEEKTRRQRPPSKRSRKRRRQKRKVNNGS